MDRRIGLRVQLSRPSDRGIAYAKAGYVLHVTHEFGSIVRSIGGHFGLPLFGYAQARVDDLSDYFDFRQSPIPFHTVKAPSDARIF